MLVLIAPDSFGGTLSAQEAAAAIAAGWSRARPDDVLVPRPMSDGGPGFVDVVAGALDSERVTVETTDPYGRAVPACVVVAAGTAYVESAQAVGLHLLAPAERDPERTTSAGLAELLRAAVSSGARRVVVGLGGSATNDGGSDLVRELGGAAAGHSLLAGVEFVVATDVDNPLLGLHGASAVFAPQKGADDQAVHRLEGRLAAWADELEGELAVSVRDRPGAGAAGGLGFALMALGGRAESGVGLVLELLGLAEVVSSCGLVVTGEGSYDWQSLRGKVVSGLSGLAVASGVPCVVLAGQATVGRRDAAAHGVDEVVSLAELAGSVEVAMAGAADWLAEAAARTALSWSPAS